VLAGSIDHGCEFSADWVSESDVSDNSVAEKSINPMAGAVEELVGNHELQRFVLFLERSNGRDGDDALDAELLESVDIGAEIELARHEAMAASVTREERDLATLEGAADVRVRRGTERGSDFDFLYFCKAGHGIESTAADDADFRLRQTTSRVRFRAGTNW